MPTELATAETSMVKRAADLEAIGIAPRRIRAVPVLLRERPQIWVWA